MMCSCLKCCKLQVRGLVTCPWVVMLPRAWWRGVRAGRGTGRPRARMSGAIMAWGYVGTPVDYVELGVGRLHGRAGGAGGQCLVGRGEVAADASAEGDECVDAAPLGPGRPPVEQCDPRGTAHGEHLREPPPLSHTAPAFTEKGQHGGHDVPRRASSRHRATSVRIPVSADPPASR